MATSPKPGAWLVGVVNAATTEPKRDLSDDGGANEVEIWLQSFGVSYSTLLDLPISMIDIKGSLSNQARAEAIIQESVDRFATALTNGATFKPVIGYKQGNSVLLIDGNNRCAAYVKARREIIPAYVVHPDTPSEVIHAMTVAANTMHGETPGASWRIKQAEFLTSLGYPLDEACRLANVKVSQLQVHQRAERATARAKSLRLSGFTELPTNQRVKLGAIPSDPVFLQAARVVIDTGMSVTETEVLLREIKASPSESLQNAVIARVVLERKLEAKNRAALARPPRIKSAKTSLITGLGKIMAADPGGLARMVLTDMERIEMKKRLERAADHILELQIALEIAGLEDRHAG